MKTLISLAAVLACTTLYADEILLKNRTVIHGDVKGAGSDKIFYLEATTLITKELPRAEAVRITYSDGLTINPHETSFDEIVKKDGSFARAKVLRITADTVIAHGQRQVIPMRLPVDELSKIVYGDGRTIMFQGQAQQSPGPRPEEKSQGEGRQQTAQAYPPPTHHIDGDMSLFILALGGIGISRNGDLCAFTNQQAKDISIISRRTTRTGTPTASTRRTIHTIRTWTSK